MKKTQLFVTIFIVLFLFSTSLVGQSNVKALKKYIKTAPKDKKIKVLKVLAETYLLDKPDTAIYYVEQVFKIEKKENLNNATLVDLYNILGGAYYFKSNFRKSIKNYESALKIVEKTANQKKLIKLLFNMGIISAELKKNNKAEEYYLKSLKIAKENPSHLNIKEIYEALAQVYETNGNYKKALKYFRKYNVKRDKELNIKTQKRITILTKRYETAEEKTLLKEIKLEKKDSDLHKAAKRENVLIKDTIKKSQEIEVLDKEKKEKEKRLQEQLKFIIFLTVIIVFISISSVILIRLNRRIKQKNKLLELQNVEIKRQHENITESIKYAKRIQNAILPPEAEISQNLPHHFILFKPRDIVSGDFYWISQKDSEVVIVAADCTGHGVPGAFMSILGVSFLNDIVNNIHCDENSITNASSLNANEILNTLRSKVKSSLHQTGKEDEAKDGMDIALCIINTDERKMQYSGAYNPLYIVRDNKLIEHKADRMPIGIHLKEKGNFTNHNIDLQKNDTIYIFSDGFVDQSGGDKGSKYMSKRFKKLLTDISVEAMSKQKEMLNTEINNWMNLDENTKKTEKQVDDILIIGIKII